jgi:hypothetical protein
MDRRLLVLIVALVAIGGAGFVWLLSADTPNGAAPAASGARLAQAPRQQRASLPPPPGQALPRDLPPPSERVQATHLTPEERGSMNQAVDGVLATAREECLRPWLQSLGDPNPSEFVFDAVTYDGRLVDIGIRSLQHDIPGDVMTCVDDKAWDAEWPEWDVQGELRLQRHIEINPQRVMDPP